MTEPHYAYVMALIRLLEKLGIETMVMGESLADHIERLLQLKADEAGEAEYASWIGPIAGLHSGPLSQDKKTPASMNSLPDPLSPL